MEVRERILVVSILKNMRSQIDSLIETISFDPEARTRAIQRQVDFHEASSPFLSPSDDERIARELGIVVDDAVREEDEKQIEAYFQEARSRYAESGAIPLSMDDHEPIPPASPAIKEESKPKTSDDAITFADELLGYKE